MIEATERMFDPELYENLRLPATEAETLPPWCYSSREWYQAEVERLHMKVWNFLGRTDRIPNRGDYFTTEYAGIPLIIVRGEDDQVRAFSNSCRHRGARVVDGEGNCNAFTCPYHGWTYLLDGTLRNARDMEDTVGFKLGDYGLIPVRLETWGGFIFVNFDEEAGGLLDYLDDAPEVLNSYNCDDLICTRIKTHEVECNWKIHIENAMEDYHVPNVHGVSIGNKAVDHFPVESKGNWFNMRERHDEYTRALLQEDREHMFPRIKTLEGHAAEGTNFVCLNPSTMLGMTLDCVWYIQLIPFGPNQTHVEVGSCFPKETTELPDFEERVQYYYKRWDKSIGEDNEIAAVQQIGVSSPLARRGRMSREEYLIPKLGLWWVSHVLGDAKAAA